MSNENVRAASCGFCYDPKKEAKQAAERELIDARWVEKHKILFLARENFQRPDTIKPKMKFCKGLWLCGNKILVTGGVDQRSAYKNFQNEIETFENIDRLFKPRDIPKDMPKKQPRRKRLILQKCLKFIRKINDLSFCRMLKKGTEK